MSDTAFFVRPAISTPKGVEWLTFTDRRKAPASDVSDREWRLLGIPDLANLAFGLARGDESATAGLARHLYPSTAALAHALAPQLQNEAALAGTMTAAILRRLRKRPARWSTLDRWAPGVALGAGLREIEMEGTHLAGIPADLQDLQLFRLLAEEDSSESQSTDELAGRVFKRLLARLSPRNRLLISLIEIQGWTVDDVATLFGWPRWLAHLRAFFARRRFRQLLGQWRAQLK